MSNNVVKEVRRESEMVIAALAGEIDMNQAPALHATLVDLVSTRPRRLILNLTGVSYIDSSGVGTLVEVMRRVNAYKGFLALVGLSDQVRSVFEITKLDRFFKIFNSEAEAIAA